MTHGGLAGRLPLLFLKSSSGVEDLEEASEEEEAEELEDEEDVPGMSMPESNAGGCSRCCCCCCSISAAVLCSCCCCCCCCWSRHLTIFATGFSKVTQTVICTSGVGNQLRRVFLPEFSLPFFAGGIIGTLRFRFVASEAACLCSSLCNYLSRTYVGIGGIFR